MSNSIDERVVVLRFDNAQFESATKTSMNTLDRLKASLKLDKSAKSLENLGKTTRTFNLGGMISAIETVGQRFSRLGIVGMTVISQLTKAAMGMAKNVFMAIPSQIAQGGWKRALNIEQAKFQIDGLGKSWEALYKDMDYAVDQTAYGIDAAAKAASQLSASGIEAGDDMKAALRGISGVAAMTSSDYESIAQIFTTVAGNGRLMGDQLLQLSSRGINAAATLAQQLGVTEGEVRKMVTKGEIDFQTFANAMDSAFGEHAKDANKTFTGAMSNVKAALSRIGADVAEVQLFNLMNVFNAIRPIINNVRYALQPFIIALNKLSLAASGRLIENLNKVEKALQPFADRGKELKSKWDEELKGIKETWNKADDEAKKTSESISESVEGLGHALDENGKVIRVTAEEAQAAWDIWNKGTYGNQPEREKNLAKVGLEYKYVQAYVNDLIAADFDLSRTTIEVADAAGEAAEKTEEQAKATEEASESAKKVEKVYGSLGAVFKRLNSEMKPGQKILAAIKNVFSGLIRIVRGVARVLEPVIAAFANWFIPIFAKVSEKLQEITGRFNDFTSKVNISTEAQNKIYNAVTKFLNGVTKVAKVIGTILKTIFEGFKKVGTAIGQLLGPIIVKIGTAIKNLAKHIKTFNQEHQTAKKIIEGVTRVISVFFDLISRGIGKIRDFLNENDRLAKAGEAIKKAFEKVWEFLKGVFEGIKNFFLELKDSEGVQKLTQALKDLWKVLKDLLSLAIQNLIDNLSTLTGKTFETPTFEKAVKVLSEFSGWLGGVIEKVAEFAGKLGDGGGIKDKIVSFFKSFGETERGERFTKFVNGLGDAFGKLKGVFSGGSSGNVSASLLGIKDVISPLSETTINGEGFKKGFGSIVEWLKSVDWSDILQNDIIPLLKTIAGVRAALKFSKLLTSVSGLLDSVADMGKSVSGFVKEMTTIQKKKLRLQTFKTIALAIVLLAGALFIISKIPTEDLPRSIGILGGIVGALIGMMYLIDKAKINVTNLAKIGTGMMALGAGMILIAGAIAIISRMKPDKIAKAGVVIAAFVFGMAGAAKIAGQSSFGGFAKLGTALLLLSVSMLILGNMKPEKLLKAGIVIGALVTMLVIANNRAENSLKKGSNGLLQLAKAVAIISVAVIGLSFVPFKRALASSIAIVAIIYGLVAASKTTKDAKLGIQNMKGLATVVAIVAGSIAGLAFFKPKRILAATAGISAVLLEIIWICKQAEVSNPIKGALAIVMIMGSITAALAILSTMNVQGMLAATLGLSAVLTSLAIAVSIFGTAGQLGPDLLIGVAYGIAAMEMVLWALIGTFALLNKINQATKKDGGDGFFKNAGKVIGDFISGIVEAVGDTALELLKSLADTLEEIAPKFQPFFDAIANMPEGLETKMKDLAGAILAISEAGFLEGLKSLIELFIGKEVDIGEPLKQLGSAMSDFYTAVSPITDWDIFDKAVTAANRIAGIGGEIKIFDPVQIRSLCNKLPDIALGLAGFYENLDGVEIDTAKAYQFKSAVNHIVGIGGKIKFGDIFQINRMLTKMPDMATNMASFMETISGVTIDTTKAYQFKSAVNHIAGIGGNIEFGDPFQIANLLTKMPYIATQLRSFYENLGTDTINVDKARLFKQAVNQVAAIGGNVSFGDPVQISNLVKKLPDIGTNFATYLNNISGVTSDNISKGKDAATALVDISNTLAGVNTSAIISMSTASANLGGFGSKIKEFFSNISGTDTSKTADVSKALSSFGSSAKSIDTSGFKSAGANAMKAFASGFNGVTIKASVMAAIKSAASAIATQAGAFRTAGTKMAMQVSQGLRVGIPLATAAGKAISRSFASGISSGSAISAGRHLASGALAGTRSVSFYDAGKNAAVGFANGISVNDFRAAAAARAMAKKAKMTAEAVLGIESPSKVFKQIGSFVAEGFGIGIDRGSRYSTLASEKMAENSIKTVANATARLSSIINDNIDTNPTITPVVDLSQVRAGAGQISTLLSNQNGIGLAASINGTMQAQAMAGSDMLNAINNLANKLDSLEETVRSNPGIDPDIMYSAVRAGASDANINMSMNGRELSRGLRDMGVAFS